jgi:carbonic anhydrase
MKRILDGLTKFQTEVYPGQRQLFERLARAQHPETLFLTCSDSRIVPDLITQTRPGDLFICRNAGNIAPAFGDVIGGVSASIEYAVVALEVKDIIVCGHSNCGAITALLHPERLADMPAVAAWLRYAERARVVVRENYPDLEGDALLDALIQENVVAQLENLRTHPSVASRLRRGQLTLHGWVYDIETGLITAWQPELQRFVPIHEIALPEDVRESTGD